MTVQVRHTQRLDRVDDRLATVFLHAFDLWRDDPRNEGYDLMLIEGYRSPARQDELYAQGRTTPGKIVTWTRNSKHCEGKAIDIAPVKGMLIPWEDKALFDFMAECMQKAGAALGVKIRNGADWDQDGIRRERGESDSPHFELVGQ